MTFVVALVLIVPASAQKLYVRPPAHNPLPLYQCFMFKVDFSERNRDQKCVFVGWRGLQIIMTPVLDLNIKSV
jgi:hypothetical protein